MLIDAKSLQRFLNAHGATLKDDGDFGDLSLKAARSYLATLGSKVTSYQPGWPDERVIVAIEQSAIKFSAGYDLGVIDGIAGVRTQIGLEKWQDYIQFQAPQLEEPAPASAPISWPRQRDMIAFYGQPGENQTHLESPYPLYLDWQLSERASGFSIHEKCHDSALRVMKRVLSAYGEPAIHSLGLDQFGGCLNVRKMRDSRSWSVHAWGAAIDWDADRNQLRQTSKTAQMAKPQYKTFLDLWAEEGWLSLGRARNFDWMHVQAARL